MTDTKKIELANAVLKLIEYETRIHLDTLNDGLTIAIDDPTLIRLEKEGMPSIFIFVDEQI